MKYALAEKEMRCSIKTFTNHAKLSNEIPGGKWRLYQARVNVSRHTECRGNREEKQFKDVGDPVNV